MCVCVCACACARVCAFRPCARECGDKCIGTYACVTVSVFEFIYGMCVRVNKQTHDHTNTYMMVIRVETRLMAMSVSCQQSNSTKVHLLRIIPLLISLKHQRFGLSPESCLS